VPPRSPEIPVTDNNAIDGMPAQPSSLPHVGAEIAGKYRIEGMLGQGGMGAVFAARNKLTGKRVAIKWLLPEHTGSSTRERLLREARIAASIEHPNVVDIYDVGEHEGGLFLVMEYLRGPSLSEVLDEVGRMDPEPLIALLVPAMRGVHAAHQAGVIHRDLKPDNILLHERDGAVVPKVVDFGVSKTVSASATPAPSLTRTGALVGTPHYMALEQVDGSKDIDSRTDVYAFGVLIYRALTGHFPFDGESLGEIILKIGTCEAATMRSLRPDLPAGLDQVVLRALSRARGKRQRDLEELARALGPFTQARPGDPIDLALLPRALRSQLVANTRSEPAATAQPTPRIPTDRRRIRVLALVGFVLAGAVLLALAFRVSEREPPAARPAVPEAAAERAPELPAMPGPELPAASAPVQPAAAPPLAAEPPMPLGVALPVKKASARPRPEKPREQADPAMPAPQNTPARFVSGARTKGLAADDF
jgi:serine/threonine protein kinase